MPNTTASPTLIAWRGIVAVVAGVGLTLNLTGYGLEWWIVLDVLRYFTNLSTLAVFAFCAWWTATQLLGRPAAATWARGLATSMTVFTGLIYATLLGGHYPDLSGWLTHIVVPAAMFADWLLVDRHHRIPGPAALITWAAATAAYLGLYVWDAHVDGAPMYPFLDPLTPGWLVGAAAMMVSFLLLGCALLGLAWLTRPRAVPDIDSHHEGQAAA